MFELNKMIDWAQLKTRLPGIAFFPAAVLYHELLLRIFDRDAAFFTWALLRIFLFSVAAGLVIYLLLDIIPHKKTSGIIGGVLLFSGSLLLCIERGCRYMFHVYYGFTVIGSMAGDVTGSFGSALLGVIFSIFPFIILSFAPLVLYIVFYKKMFCCERNGKYLRLFVLLIFAVLQASACMISIFGSSAQYYTHNFTINNAIPNFGLVNSIKLEVEYAVFGLPQHDLSDFNENVSLPEEPFTDADGLSEPDGSVNEDDPAPQPEVPKEYGYNAMDIDFEALANAETNKTLKSMHEYFGSLTPSQQNEYTGMFKGKNLIFITAEAFSPYVISKDLTPTLYRLSHEGFVFNNYYQPDWTQSTVGGEFANVTGIIPNWVNGGLAATAAAKNYMPFTLGNQLSKSGYNVPAWHNHLYTYYGRNEYMKTFGYDYKGGRGGGLDIPSGSGWPESDLEMIEATIDGYINDYTENGVNFHAYYMSVSGHANYSFAENSMSLKNREAAVNAYPNASSAVQAYIACNLELEYALEHMVNKLEAAGIAEDTLIVLGADHYPYALSVGNTDYYNELRGFEDTESLTSRYLNTLIMWSAAIDEPVVIDTPCSSIDIVPTLSNLFGLEYDSRLLSGRDIFATNYEADKYSSCMPLVVFANKGEGNSWITAAGTYEASTRTFTPNDGITVDENYVKSVNRLISGKVSYAKLILSENYYKKVLGS